MVNTRLTNPDLITPNISSRVIPPRRSNLLPGDSALASSLDANQSTSFDQSFFSVNMSSSENTPQPAGSSSSPAPDNPPHSSSSSDSKSPASADKEAPPRSLQDIVADELEKSGLDGIDTNLLKVLLIRSLSTMSLTEAQSTLVSDLVKWQQLGSSVSPQLFGNGSNFPVWSSSLQSTINAATGVKYFLSVD